MVFNVAGICGLGTLRAAKRAGVWGVGVDTDQSGLGPHILTSVVKRYDGVMRTLLEQVRDGQIPGGVTTALDTRRPRRDARAHQSEGAGLPARRVSTLSSRQIVSGELQRAREWPRTSRRAGRPGRRPTPARQPRRRPRAYHPSEYSPARLLSLDRGATSVWLRHDATHTAAEADCDPARARAGIRRAQRRARDRIELPRPAHCRRHRPTPPIGHGRSPRRTCPRRTPSSASPSSPPRASRGFRGSSPRLPRTRPPSAERPCCRGRPGPCACPISDRC